MKQINVTRTHDSNYCFTIKGRHFCVECVKDYVTGSNSDNAAWRGCVKCKSRDCLSVYKLNVSGMFLLHNTQAVMDECLRVSRLSES
jgi:hypothetical protein